MPGDLRRTFFLNSGAEAIETALQAARLHTGRTEVIALRQAYHGRTSMASAITAHAPWRVLPATSTGVTHALSPYPYRAPFGAASDEELVEIYARDLIEVIETTTNGRPAAFIAETIQGVGGYIVPPRGYFQRMADIIRSYGGLFISDEVQAGFGRTGGHWFGIEHWGVVPDIMVMAKGIAGGHAGGCHDHDRRDRGELARQDPLDLRRQSRLHGRDGGHAGRHAGRGRTEPGA